ncbi:MAG: 3-deoxy-D-manno-octulosonic acid transferase, partial [Verrucomicrobiales bacterium]
VAERVGVPVRLVNARMSPRSRRRFERFAAWIRPVYSKLDGVAVQEEGAVEVWRKLGVSAECIEVTGSLKFDPANGVSPSRREDFAELLDRYAAGRRVVLAASTHAGEEVLVGRAVRAAGGFFLCVPRHAERGAEVRQALEAEGFEVVLKSDSAHPVNRGSCCLVVDTTGELCDWTAHADVVVVGKSFLGEGGQNPAEAIRAGKALVFGPHMENFEPLASDLVVAGGAHRVGGEEALRLLLKQWFSSEVEVSGAAARRVLGRHEGATRRVLDMLLRSDRGTG